MTEYLEEPEMVRQRRYSSSSDQVKKYRKYVKTLSKVLQDEEELIFFIFEFKWKLTDNKICIFPEKLQWWTTTGTPGKSRDW